MDNENNALAFVDSGKSVSNSFAVRTAGVTGAMIGATETEYFQAVDKTANESKNLAVESPTVNSGFSDKSDTMQIENAAESSVIEKRPTTTINYGSDVGDNFFAQLGSAAAGGSLGYFISKKLSGDSKLWSVIGGLTGAVVIHKLGSEFATDIQRGNQYVDQQKAEGKSEGKLADRFAAVLGNIKVKGQNFTPNVSTGADITD